MSQPVRIFRVIVLVSLPTVMFGGFSLPELAHGPGSGGVAGL
jgi:hypothetical protein